MQGLPPLSQLPGSPPPGPPRERHSTLPPLKGGALSTQARRALGDTSPPTSASILPGRLLPRSLPPLKVSLGQTSPGAVPRPSVGATPLFRNGKGPSDGKSAIKKTTPLTSSEEDVSGSEMVGAGSGSALPTISSPPFKTTRSLPPLTLPSIGGTALPSIRSPTGPPVGMPSRRTSVDPFAADSTTIPARRTTPSLPPLSPPGGRNSISKAPPIPLMTRGPPLSPRYAQLVTNNIFFHFVYFNLQTHY